MQAHSNNSSAPNLEQLFSAHLTTIAPIYAAAAARAGAGSLLIDAGHNQNYFRDDQGPNFRANPYFTHWLPIGDAEHCALLLRDGKKPLLLFHQPRDFWHMPPADPTGFWLDQFDIRIVADEEALARELAAATSPDTLYLGPSSALPQNLGITRSNVPAALDYLDFHRAKKTSYEIETMRSATRSAVKGHRAAAAAFAAGQSEYQIHMAYLAASTQTERDVPYGNIVALNAHASVLHYQHQERTLPEVHRSLLIDAGARCRGYAADITRTYAATLGRFADLVQALDLRQQQICAAIQPGMPYHELHVLAHQLVAAVLQEIGVLRCSAEHAFAQGLTRAFLPHGLGHLLGILTHDAGGHLADAAGKRAPPSPEYPMLRNTRTIAVDQVFTIEPGIYFIPMLLDEVRSSAAAANINWQVVDELLPYGGVRIEDNVRVLEHGVENFTRDAFVQLAERSDSQAADNATRAHSRDG